LERRHPCRRFASIPARIYLSQAPARMPVNRTQDAYAPWMRALRGCVRSVDACAPALLFFEVHFRHRLSDGSPVLDYLNVLRMNGVSVQD